MALVVTVALGVVLAGRGEDDRPVAAIQVEGCRGLLAEASRECWSRAFRAAVAGRDDPRPVVAAIERVARREGGSLLTGCHGVMHTVGRTYALQQGLSLAELKDVLPRSNDPGCSAGFAHGVVTGLAEDIDAAKPQEVAAVCAGAGTRYQRYSCVHGLGHAFMRIHGDSLEPALALCDALGEASPDCAQGAYHDYWFAVVGADDALLLGKPVTDPRRLCAAQPARFVRPCWYRAFVDNRPAGIEVDSPEHLDVLCDGLEGVQREACMTAASVIGPADPELQLELCAGLGRPADQVGCIRGTKAQNLLGAPTTELVRLIGRCDLFAGATRAACYRWLGTALAVLTDGAFGRTGCPQLTGDAGRSCREGAAAMEGALVTFS